MPVQATVASALSWITDPTDPGGAMLQCGSRVNSPFPTVTDGDVVKYSGNRTQLVTYGSLEQSLPLVFDGLTLAQVQQLLAWQGRTLLLRRIDGTRYYGGYLELDVQPYPAYVSLYAANITWNVLTYSDAV